jgi:6-pyruvoyltetrahydropterin/6-carboxytetrahydropterin synthase
MTILRVTKRFTFETSHALHKHEGPCINIHGHSYKLWVTVRGTPYDKPNTSEDGMVIDFAVLKKIVVTEIISKYDHVLILKYDDPRIELIQETATKLISFDVQPTCENLVLHFANLLKDKFPKNIELYQLKLEETETSYAEWFASDNNTY